MTGSAALVPVILNQTIQAHMLLDTGATYTVVSRGLAASLGLYEASRATLSTANGLISVPLARLQSIKVGAAEALDLTVAIQDVSVNSTVGGLLGLDFLSRFNTSITVIAIGTTPETPVFLPKAVPAEPGEPSLHRRWRTGWSWWSGGCPR